MMYDLGRVERVHRAINSAKPGPSGTWSAMRTCTGACRRSRSIMQFAKDSTVCMRCKRRGG